MFSNGTEGTISTWQFSVIVLTYILIYGKTSLVTCLKKMTAGQTKGPYFNNSPSLGS